MARWAYITVPIGIAILVGTWWIAGRPLATVEPRLGAVIVVTPKAVDTGETPTAPGEPPPLDDGTAATVAPAPPPDAGIDDPDDSEEDADDDADDSEE